MIGGNNFISIQLRNQWTGGFSKILFFRTDEKKKSKEKSKKLKPEKGGLITLDDDLKVNSQKLEVGKNQLWTVDPQDYFKLHQIVPHRYYHNDMTTLRYF